MKEIKDYRLFKKIIRKYNNRHCIRRVDYFRGKRFVSYWEKEDWICYIVDSVDKLTPMVWKYIRLMVGEETINEFDFETYLIEKPHLKLDEESVIKEYVFEGIILTNRDAYALLCRYEEDKKNKYTYPIFKIIKRKID